MERTTVYLTNSLKRRLKQEAASRGRPEAVLLREALEQYLVRHDRPRPRAVGRSRDGGIARNVARALDDLGFGTR
ncbi:MAG TPA: CopG family transcriptional regulator [Polyangia bacterium]|nr:CopG family transcriptional regulator [Polyangia bacterium]